MRTTKLFLPVIISMTVLTSAYYAVTIFSKKTQAKVENEEEEVLVAFEMMGLWGQMRAYPYESIPEGKFNVGFKKMKDDEERKKNLRSSKITSEAAAVMSTPWTPLAPKNFGGRILSLAFHPTNANIMWVGSASGGLWKTTNGGTGAADGINWVNVPTGFPVLGISAIAVNQSNANEIYLGTGEVYNSGGNGYQGHNDRIFRGSYGIGVLKSIDGGITWSKALDFSASSLGTPRRFASRETLLANPET